MKKADIVVKVGEYQKDGETKNRYENVGVLMEGDNGQYILLKRTFNPAGVPNQDSRDNILLSIFTKKDNNKTDSEEF